MCANFTTCTRLVGGLLLCGAAIATGEIRRAGAEGVSGHLEKPNDPPNVRRAVETGPTLPPAALTRNGHTSVQVNVSADGQNIVGDAGNEPSIAVDPTDPNIMVIGWRQFSDVNSDFRQAGWGYSHDGGQTWTFPGVLESGVFRSDPVLSSDNDGNFFYYSLGDTFVCDMFVSSDGGMTWAPQVFAWGGDKQWMTVDRSGTSSDGVVYGHWGDNGTPYLNDGRMTRSFDGGQSFDGPYFYFDQNWNYFTAPFWGTSTVLADGTLVVAGATRYDGSGARDIVVARSADARDEFVHPRFWRHEIDMNVRMAGWSVPNPVGLLGQVWVDADRSGGPLHDSVYVLASGEYFGPQFISNLEVGCARSRDGGQTWSGPVRVTDFTESAALAWMAAMSVAPNGRIDAIWSDTRLNTFPFLQLNRYTQLYYSYSTDGGVTWSANLPVSPPFDYRLGYPGGQRKIGDYYTMVSHDDSAVVAYAATYNGEQDVYFVRVGDCDGNGVHDSVDAQAAGADTNANGIPDACEPDCDGDGIADVDENLALGDGTGDGLVTGADLPVFGGCMSGPDVMLSAADPDCEYSCSQAFVFDWDLDVDLEDLAELQVLVAGPALP
jgi:hypothetical protein